MTVIAVKKIGDNKFEIAGDTQTTNGHNKFPVFSKSDSELQSTGKLVKVNEMILGCAGKTAQISLAYRFCKTTAPKTMNKDDVLDWLITLKEYISKKVQIKPNEINISGILIKDNKCFAFYSFLEVIEINSFHSIGSGKYIALGALEVGSNVEDAVKAAIKYDLYCSGQVTKLEVF